MSIDPRVSLAAAVSRGSPTMLQTAGNHAVHIQRRCALLDALLIADNRDAAVKVLGAVVEHTRRAGSCLIGDQEHPPPAAIPGRRDHRKDGCALAERAERLAKALWTLSAEGYQDDAWTVWRALFRVVDELSMVIDDAEFERRSEAAREAARRAA